MSITLHDDFRIERCDGAIIVGPFSGSIDGVAGKGCAETGDDLVGDFAEPELFEAPHSGERPFGGVAESELNVVELAVCGDDEPLAAAVGEDAPHKGAVLEVAPVNGDRLIGECLANDLLGHAFPPVGLADDRMTDAGGEHNAPGKGARPTDTQSARAAV